MARNLDITKFDYNGIKYNLCIDTNDASGLGCVAEIVTRNEYELNKYFNLGSAILDIGANCGVATMILAKQNPQANIYSFEPDLPTFNLLHANILINDLTNVRIFNMAISDNKTTSLQLNLHPNFSGGNSTCSDNQIFSQHFGTATNYYSVNCSSIDKVAKEFNIQQISLIKIDCEGAEYEALYDSQMVKEGRVSSIVGEFHNLKYNTNAKGNSQDLMQYCRSHIKDVGRITILDM